MQLTGKWWFRCIKRADGVVDIAHDERERFEGASSSNALHNTATEAPVVPKERVALWNCVKIFVEEYYTGNRAVFFHVFVLKRHQSAIP